MDWVDETQDSAAELDSFRGAVGAPDRSAPASHEILRRMGISVAQRKPTPKPDEVEGYLASVRQADGTLRRGWLARNVRWLPIVPASIALWYAIAWALPK
ncbi:MAG TPA: hypothetical protein VMW80_14240 [Candidatus Dormibacteraeota bacterium]|nr:hypothetical protein [Candidatus Dormibacteraeota bacterium]